MQPTNLDTYLESLDLPPTIQNKIRSTLAFYIENKLMNPTSIFINQDKDADQNIRADRLWLFDEVYCAEADISNGKISVDVAALKSRIRRYEIIASDSDFDEPGANKYLSISATIEEGLLCRFKAFGKNRRVLWDAFAKHIKPNIVTE